MKMMDLVKRRGCARYACPLILAIAGLLEAQDGAALYKERCASCHDSPQGRIPSIGAIKQMTGEAVYAAMLNGAMKSQASGLSTQQLISLLVYIAPAGIANPNPAFQKNCAATTPLKPGASCARRRPAGKQMERMEAPASPMRDIRTRRQLGLPQPTCPGSSSNGRSIWGL